MTSTVPTRLVDGPIPVPVPYPAEDPGYIKHWWLGLSNNRAICTPLTLYGRCGNIGPIG